VLEAVKAGAYPSIRAAAIAVGAAKKHVSCVATPEGVARAALRHLSPAGVAALIGYLRDPATLPKSRAA
jgi:hypothetical protein